ncbi:hypothetical protein BT93_F3284 [Corymbia citriodora subsp. variegata]|nr:hypothetical protein BT93_F3284 [Corymbia citriodora subsp. variegata]
MYGRKASQLVKELTGGEKGQLKAFNDDLINQVIKECGSHHVGLQALFRNMQEEGLDIQTTRNADFYGALIHHLSLTRNKRCLMAYMYNRADVVRSLRWKLGRVLPNELVTKLSNSEKEYFKGYSAALDAYMNEMNLDLTVCMIIVFARIWCHRRIRTSRLECLMILVKCCSLTGLPILRVTQCTFSNELMLNSIFVRV